MLIIILLKGLTGPVDGKDYGIMLPMKSNDDNWIANVASYIRTMNDTTTISNRDVRNIREETKNREVYWTLKELGR